MRTLADVAAEFPAAADGGLSDAQVAASRQRHGSNRLTPLPRESLWRMLLEKFDEPIIRILLAATLLKITVDLFAVSALAGSTALLLVASLVGAGLAIRGWRPFLPALLFAAAIVLVFVGAVAGNPSYDGLAVMIAVGLATGVAFAAEYKSEREFDFLNAEKDAIQVKTLRAGEFRTIPLDELVVGDCVLLEMGDEIPADGRMEQANELQIDQSLMTGESEPVRKTVCQPGESKDGPEHPGCVYRGTQVVDGVGKMRVIAVGDATMLGEIARSLGEGQATSTTEPTGGASETNSRSPKT